MIAIVGATGFTGRRVCQALARGEGALRLVGRRRAALLALADELPTTNVDVRVADVADPATVDRALSDHVDVVVNCVGPYLEHGLTVVRAALRASAHYIDLSAEQAHVDAVIRSASGPAAVRGCTLLPGHGADWAFSCAAAGLVTARLAEVLHLDAWHDLGPFQPSRGTIRSMLGMTGEPAWSWHHGRVPLRPWPATSVDLPGVDGLSVPFPGGDVLLWGHTRPGLLSASSNLLLPANEARAVAAAWAAIGTWRPGPTLRGVLQGFADRLLADPDDVADTPWQVVVRGRSADGAATARITGTSTYDDTATLVAATARRLAEDGSRSSGVVDLSQAVDIEAFLDGLAVHGITWSC